MNGLTLGKTASLYNQYMQGRRHTDFESSSSDDEGIRDSFPDIFAGTFKVCKIALTSKQ